MLVLGTTGPAFAEEEPADRVQIEKIVVTGSNVKRTDIESALPVQVITREDIDRRGVISAAALMNEVSANLISSQDTVFVGGAPGRLVPSANLRGLGEASTLVLLNGRRAANYAVNGGTVNLNFIPLAAVERVEILKDGASAIYGADAMAGVVNFILRRDFTGIQLSGYGAVTQHGGGNQQQATVAAGYGDLARDRFNAFVTATYQNNEALHARDRAFSSTSYRPDEGINNLNTETFPANIRTGPSTYVNPSFESGCAPPVTLPIPGTQRCGHDSLAVFNTLQPVERTYVVAGGTWQYLPDQELSAQYVYSHNYQVWTRNQAPSSESFNGDHRRLVYPASGPFYPTVFAAAHGIRGDLNLFYRAIPLGPITDDSHLDAQHAVLGAQGLLAGWDYDAAWVYSENTQKYFGRSGRVSESRLLDAMATGLINPFGPSGPEGQALLAGTAAPGEVFHTKAITSSVEGKVSTTVYRLPAGPLAMALGVEGRREQIDIAYSPEQTSGDILGSLTAPSASGSRSVGAAFAELNAPLAKGLETQLALRYDHYSDFGGTTNPKVALRWQPFDTLLFRSSWGTGFRAPTLLDLYTPAGARVTANQADPLRCPFTGLATDCLAAFAARIGGNLDLEPETSEQFNVGVVWEAFTGLSIDVDYWKISKTATIGALTDNVLFNYFDRFKDTNVVRGPADPAFPTLPGPIQYVFEGAQNLGNLRTSGVDVDIVYRGPATPFGRFGAGLNGTYVATWEQQLDSTGYRADYVSAVGRYVTGAIPRWKHYLALTWNFGAWGATLTQTFSSSYTDAVVNSVSADHRNRTVGAYDIWNAQGTYTGFRNTVVAIGIKNLFDRAPPFSHQSDAGQVMYDARYADPRGRLFYAQLTFAFGH